MVFLCAKSLYVSLFLESLSLAYKEVQLDIKILFSISEHRSIVKEKYPNLENRNITKILGEWWTSLGPDEKNAFNNLAAELKEHHHSKEHQAVVHRKPASAQQQQQQHLLQHIQPRDLQLVENTSSNLSAGENILSILRACFTPISFLPKSLKAERFCF